MNFGLILSRLTGHPAAAIFTCMGVAMSFAAIFLAYRALRITNGTRTGGTIIAWHKRTTDGTTSYAPIFRFRAGMDGEFEVQSSTVWENQAGDTNVPVSILYDENDPKRADIEGEHHPWRPVLAFLALAGGVFAVAWQAGA